jgi:hypothetical protein
MVQRRKWIPLGLHDTVKPYARTLYFVLKLTGNSSTQHSKQRNTTTNNAASDVVEGITTALSAIALTYQRQPTKSKTGLQHLPNELLDEIFKYVWAKDNGVLKRVIKCNSKHFPPAFMQVCARFRAVGARVVLHNAQLLFIGTVGGKKRSRNQTPVFFELRRWLTENYMEPNVSFITEVKHLEFPLFSRSLQHAYNRDMALTKRCPKLETFQIVLDIGCLIPPQGTISYEACFARSEMYRLLSLRRLKKFTIVFETDKVWRDITQKECDKAVDGFCSWIKARFAYQGQSVEMVFWCRFGNNDDW